MAGHDSSVRADDPAGRPGFVFFQHFPPIYYMKNKNILKSSQPASRSRQPVAGTPKSDLPGNALDGPSGLVTIREIDRTERVRALVEGRVRLRPPATVPWREPELQSQPVPVEWMFAVPLPPRGLFKRRETWVDLYGEIAEGQTQREEIFRCPDLPKFPKTPALAPPRRSCWVAKRRKGAA